MKFCACSVWTAFLPFPLPRRWTCIFYVTLNKILLSSMHIRSATHVPHAHTFTVISRLAPHRTAPFESEQSRVWSSVFPTLNWKKRIWNFVGRRPRFFTCWRSSLSLSVCATKIYHFYNTSNSIRHTSPPYPVLEFPGKSGKCKCTLFLQQDPVMQIFTARNSFDKPSSCRTKKPPKIKKKPNFLTNATNCSIFELAALSTQNNYFK